MSKNTVIFGDSYSTFAGFIPNGYAVYYPNENQSNVSSVEQTWWHALSKECDLNIVLNNSWSGSTICHTGYGGGDCSASSSFIYRLSNLIKEDYFIKHNIEWLYRITKEPKRLKRFYNNNIKFVFRVRKIKKNKNYND